MTANTKPSVSVIIPTYNRATLIKRSIQSVLKQTFDDFEVIVVDDSSSDNTKEVVASLQDVRIRYFRHESNRGGSAARNTGIEKAQGELIAFQDSDDEWLPDKLEKQIKMLANAPPSVGVVYTGFWRISGDNREYIPHPGIKKTQGNIHQELLIENFVTTQTVLVKKKCFQKVGMFDETLPRFQDWDLVLRISKYFEFLYVPEPLVIAYFTEGSISSNNKALSIALELILIKYLDDFNRSKEAYYKHITYLFRLNKEEKNLKKCRKYLKIMFKKNYKIGLISAIIFSYFGFSIFNLYWDFAEKFIQRINLK